MTYIEAVELTDRLDEIVREAPSVRFLGRARVDLDAAYEILDALRAQYEPGVDLADEAWGTMDQLDDALYGSRKLPFSRDALLDRKLILDLISDLREQLRNRAFSG